MTKISLIGRRVKINWDEQYRTDLYWDGIYTVVDEKDYMIYVRHPEHGLGGFYPESYEILPLTKLEKALR